MARFGGMLTAMGRLRRARLPVGRLVPARGDQAIRVPAGAAESPGATRAPVPGVEPDRRFAWVAGATGVLSTAVFTWVITLGRADLLAQRPFSDVFDVQARAMLDGHLDVPTGSLAFEGFGVDGQTYTYFGVFPSLIRMPVLVLTDRLDGRLTTLSMVIGFAVAYAAAALLIDRVRRVVSADRAWTTTGLVLAGLGLAAVGLSSNLTFLAGGARVYNEAALWGCSGVLAAFAVLAGQLLQPRPSRLVWAAAWTAVAWLSRGSMGLAPTLALALTGVAQLLGWRGLRRFALRVPASARPRQVGVALLVAALVPMAAFVAINTAKFNTPFSAPFSAQVGNDAVPARQAALDEYGGGLFSLRLLPATVWQTIRPDLVSPSGQWPFLEFTRNEPIDVGDPVWDNVEPSAGALVTMPLLVLLGGVGLAAVVWSRGRGPTGRLVTLAPMAAGAAVAAAVPLTIAFVAQRYITDAVPLLVCAAAAGIAVGDRWAAVTRLGGGRRAGVLLGAAALLLVGVWVTLSVTWLHQRFEAAPDNATTAAALRTQAAVAERLSTPAVPVERRAELPADPVPGTNVVIGDCDGLYRGGDVAWRPLEVTSARGRYHLRIRWDALSATPPSRLLTLGAGDDVVVVTLRRLDETRVQVRLARNGADISVGSTTAEAGREHDLVVDADPARLGVGVTADGTGVAFGFGAGPDPPSVELGVSGGSPSEGPPLPARVTVVDDPTPTCDALIDGDP